MLDPIGGGLDLSAGIGPGQLQDLNLSVKYNPAHEEDTEIHGHSALHIPAHAGLRLKESAKLGFEAAWVPKGVKGGDGLRLAEFANLRQLVDQVLGR